MKRELKSASKRIKPFLFLALFSLGGCADTPWPSWITGEPDEAVLNAPRAVMRPQSPAAKDWPSLADVPNKKPKFSDVLELQDQAERLRSDQLKAQVDKERIQNISIPEPLERKENEEAVSEKAFPPSFALTP